MAKDRSFASKTLKIGIESDTCPVCGTAYTFLKHVSTAKSEKSNAWKFNKKMVKVCNCNEKEIYG